MYIHMFAYTFSLTKSTTEKLKQYVQEGYLGKSDPNRGLRPLWAAPYDFQNSVNPEHLKKYASKSASAFFL